MLPFEHFLLMHVQGINVKFKVYAFDMNVIAIVNIYSKCCNWGLVLELFNTREGWNLYI